MACAIFCPLLALSAQETALPQLLWCACPAAAAEEDEAGNKLGSASSRQRAPVHVTADVEEGAAAAQPGAPKSALPFTPVRMTFQDLKVRALGARGGWVAGWLAGRSEGGGS